MNTVREDIIEYIKENRISTTEVADCLGKTGVLPNLLPINSRQFRVGTVKWVYAYNESNWSVHEQLQTVEKGKIILIDSFNCDDRAIIGELVSKYLVLYRQSPAIIVNGKVRDAHRLIAENYPVWCSGVSPVGCFNNKCDEPLDEIVETTHRNNYDNSVAVCDDSGVVIIPKDQITNAFFDKLVFIEKQEDQWFDCIDYRKWDTFRTVCKKDYLKEKK